MKLTVKMSDVELVTEVWSTSTVILACLPANEKSSVRTESVCEDELSWTAVRIWASINPLDLTFVILNELNV